IEVRDGVTACVHASERPPAGVDLHRRPTSDELKERRFGHQKKAPAVAGTESGPAVAAAGGSIACIGDGIEGMRVQTVYARAADVADRFDSVAAMIRQYASDADYQINVSAGVSGQGRRVRFVTANCELSIARVTLTSTGDDSFQAMRQQLQTQGYNRSDRKYLVWMDASVGICGLGELYADDSASADNANNRGPAYARVDAPCWGYAEAHELLHTLGAVQDSAPNSSGAGHCVDENDTMCYVDTSGSPLRSACPSQPSWQVDCSLDDYFNAAPDAAGYLAAHWNVADSAFLEGGPPPPPPPQISASVPSSFYAGNVVTVRAYVTVPAGRTYTVRWLSSRSDCKFFNASGPTNTYYCPVTAAGGGQVTAHVTDSLGMSSSASGTYRLATPSRRRATIASLRSSRTSIRRGATVTLTGKLVDASTGKAIIGMRVTIYYRRAGASSWSKLTSRTTSRTGTFSLTAKPSRTTTYMLLSWTTSTWASDQSNTRRISVS
ncbi:MAG: reprolysin-like metallopeptidase, partial [Actinomycetota bacterium]